MTETTCSGTCQILGDMTVGNVGGPMAAMEVRLINWSEGNYRISDKPYPREELVLGGEPVTRGYYKNSVKTKEDFFIENGKQFFKSGDIGELRDDGSFRLIDRKKDLVKLQLGEYVSLGKVEAQMKTKLERSRQSARECRARKKLRYQYLDDLILEREKANELLKEELIKYQKWCHELDKGRIPDGLQEMLTEFKNEQQANM